MPCNTPDDLAVVSDLGLVWLAKDHSFVYLGSTIGTKVDLDAIWQKILSKIIGRLHFWKKHNLSFKGKVLIIKSLGLSQLNYVSFGTAVDKSSLSKIETSIWKFLWNGKKDRISRSVLMNPWQKGGLCMVSAAQCVQACQAKLVSRIQDPSCATFPWVMYIRGLFDISSGLWSLTLSSLLSSSFPSHRLDLPTYWQQAFKAWQAVQLPCSSSSSSMPVCDILKQPLFHNPLIVHEGKPLSQNKWLKFHQGGVTYVRDLWDGSRFIDFQELHRKFGVRVYSKTLNHIIDSIPTTWKERLFSNAVPDHTDSIIIAPVSACSSSSSSSYLSSSIKSFKKVLVQATATPTTGPTKWGAAPWKTLWRFNRSLLHKCPRDIHFQILHSSLPVGAFIEKWSTSTTCGLCDSGVLESLEHLFWHCHLARSLWQTVSQRLTVGIGFSNALLGVSPFPRSQKVRKKEWSVIFSAAITAIWKQRNSAVFNRQRVSLTSLINSFTLHVSLFSATTT